MNYHIQIGKGEIELEILRETHFTVLIGCSYIYTPIIYTLLHEFKFIVTCILGM